MDKRSPIEIMLRLHRHFIRINAMISDSMFWTVCHLCIVQNNFVRNKFEQVLFIQFMSLIST